MDWTLLYYIIPALVMLITAGITIRIYAQKLPKVAALDLEASAKHRQAQRKATIIEERLARRMASNKALLAKVFAPIGKGITWALRSLFARIKQLEDRYRNAARGVVSDGTSPASGKLSLAKTLQEAGVFYEESKYDEAEKSYIKAIAADSTSVEAYRGLAKVYMAKKDREHAIETLQFVQQLQPNDEAVWRDMGALYMEDGADDQALEAYEKAAELAPNNPKNLDLVIQAAIACKLKYRAQSALDSLKDVNPENNAIGDYQTQIDAL